MRIAFLSTFYPYRGGIAQFNAALYRALEKKHDVKAFTFTRQYPDILFPGKSQMVAVNDVVDDLHAEKVLDTINPLSYFSCANKISKWKPDLVITKFWMPFFAPSLGTVFQKLKKNSKTLAILDNVIPHEKRPGDIAFTKFFLRQNNGFVVMSDSVKKDLLSLSPNAKYLFHPHPLYDHFGEKMDVRIAREKLSLPLDKKLVLFFGFIRDYKGLDTLIESFAKLDDSFHLCIAGEVYGSFDKYEQRIEALNLKNRVSIHARYIADNEVSSFFSAADVCVLPYKSATQSGITSIAYHFNLPVIATNVGGLSEYIEHYKTGLIIPNGNADSISEAIRNYFDQSLSKRFANGIEEKKQELSWTHLADEIEKFSKEI